MLFLLGPEAGALLRDLERAKQRIVDGFDGQVVGDVLLGLLPASASLPAEN